MQVTSKPELLAQIILDCTSHKLAQHVVINKNMLPDIEKLSRNMCYALHIKRSLLMIQQVN